MKWEIQKDKMQYLFDFRMKKYKVFPKRHNNLYKSLENVSRGIFGTQSNIYDGAFFAKTVNG